MHIREWIWPVGQVVKTEASHAFNMGSNPVRVTNLIVDRRMKSEYNVSSCSSEQL